ncbi:MAG: hypothetical protein MRY79_06210, partial [Alphaproteobacteria bacterium]|nr:hypothetical protein [Alphaproteobacteria bacterium]
SGQKDDNLFRMAGGIASLTHGALHIYFRDKSPRSLAWIFTAEGVLYSSAGVHTISEAIKTGSTAFSGALEILAFPTVGLAGVFKYFGRDKIATALLGLSTLGVAANALKVDTSAVAKLDFNNAVIGVDPFYLAAFCSFMVAAATYPFLYRDLEANDKASEPQNQLKQAAKLPPPSM